MEKKVVTLLEINNLAWQGKTINKIHKELTNKRSEYYCEVTKFLMTMLKKFGGRINTKGLILVDDTAKRVPIACIEISDKGHIICWNTQRSERTFLLAEFPTNQINYAIAWITKNLNKEVKSKLKS